MALFNASSFDNLLRIFLPNSLLFYARSIERLMEAGQPALQCSSFNRSCPNFSLIIRNCENGMETFCTNCFDFFKQKFCKSLYVLSQIEVFIQDKIIEIFIFEWNINKCKNPPTNHSKRLQLMTFSIKCFLSILLLVFNQCDHVGLFLKNLGY